MCQSVELPVGWSAFSDLFHKVLARSREGPVWLDQPPPVQFCGVSHGSRRVAAPSFAARVVWAVDALVVEHFPEDHVASAELQSGIDDVRYCLVNNRRIGGLLGHTTGKRKRMQSRIRRHKSTAIESGAQPASFYNYSKATDAMRFELAQIPPQNMRLLPLDYVHTEP